MWSHGRIRLRNARVTTRGNTGENHVENHAASQAYIADTLTAAENMQRSECIDHELHVANCTLSLDDKRDNEDARRGWETAHHSTQVRLAKVLKMGMPYPLPAKRVPTLTKVNTAFSGWFGQITLEEPATPGEEEAHCL